MLKNEFYRIAYKYHERWSPFPATVEDWEQAGQEAAQMGYERGNDRFLMALLAAVCDDMGRECKKERGDAA